MPTSSSRQLRRAGARIVIGDSEFDIREVDIFCSHELVDITSLGDAHALYVQGLPRVEARLVVVGSVLAGTLLGALALVEVHHYRFRLRVTRADTRCVAGALVETTLHGVADGAVEYVMNDSPDVPTPPVDGDDLAAVRAISLDGVPCRP